MELVRVGGTLVEDVGGEEFAGDEGGEWPW